jgi:hypothetical protein
MLYTDAPISSWWEYSEGGGLAGKILSMKLRRASSSVFYPFRYVVKYSERNSFNRTIRIMKKSGLITYDRIFGTSALTEKGKGLAIKLDKEMRKSVEDFSLVSQVVEELKREAREKEESERRSCR